MNLETRPNVIPWPPLIYIAAFFAAYALNSLLSVPLPDHWVVKILGSLAIGVGLALDLWAAVSLYLHRTSIMPHRAASRLVTQGPYRFTRNPIYLANMLVMIGISFLIANGWLTLFAFLSAAIVDRVAIQREEEHLHRRFGDGWKLYAERTRRWL